MDSSKEFLSRRQASKFFNSIGIPISYDSLARLKFDVPYYRIGSSTFYRQSELVAWLESKRVSVEIRDISEKPPEPEAPPAKVKEPKAAPPNLEDFEVGAEFEGRIKLGKYVWLDKVSLDRFRDYIPAEDIELATDELDAWVAQAEPLPGTKGTKEFEVRKRKAWNGAASFRSWALAKVQKNKPKQTSKFNPKDLYGSDY